MMVITVPLSAAALGSRELQIGVLVGLPSLVRLVGDVPCARLADVVGRKPLLIAGGGVLSAAGVVLASTTHYLGLVMGIGLGGLSGCLFFAPALAHLSESCAEELHARVQGYNGALQGLAMLCGSLAAGTLISSAGYQPAFSILGFFGVLTLFSVLILGRSACSWDDSFSFAEIGTAYRRALSLLGGRNPVQMGAWIAVLYGTTLCIGDSFFPLYAIHEVGYSPVEATSMLAVRNLALTSGSFLFGRTVSWLGLFATVVVSQALEVVGLALIPRSLGVLSLLALLAAQGIGLGLSPAAANILLAEGTAFEERATGFAAIGVPARISTLVVPSALGLLAEFGGLALIFYAGAALTGLCFIALVVSALRWRIDHF